MSEAFHVRLKRIRKSRGLTMRELAREIDVPETTYREWEYGRAVQGQPYESLARTLDVSLKELLTGEKIGQNDIMKSIEEIENSVNLLRRKMMDYL